MIGAIRVPSRRVRVSSRLPCFAGALAAALLAGGLCAEESEGEAHRLGEVVVRAEPEPDPVTDAAVPAPSQELTTSVLDRLEIEDMRPTTAVDALDFLPSVQVRRKGRKNPVSLSIRGEGNVTVLLDGMNLQARENYRFIHFLPASMIREIRVIRDSTSLLYGPPQLTSPNGIMGYGGVIDFRLREPPEDAVHGEVRAEVARFEENLEHLHLAGPLGANAGYIVSVDNHYYSGPGGENMSYDFRDFFGRLKFRYAPQSYVTTTLIVDRGWRELQKAESYSYYASYDQEFNPWETNVLMVQVHHAWSEAVSTRIEAFYRYHEATLYDHHLGGRQFDSRESKRGVNVRQTIRTADRNTLRVGGQVGYWNCPTGMMYYGGWTPRGTLRQYPRRELQYSLYLQDEFAAVPDRLILDGGVRWDRTYVYKGYTANGPGFGISTNGGIPFEDRWQDPAISYSLGARWQVTPTQVLTARGAVSTEAASSDFVTRDGRQLPNTQETRLELGYGVTLGERWKTAVNLFWKHIDNGLRYAGRYDADPLPGPANVAWVPYWDVTEYERVGVETIIEGRLTPHLAGFLNVTLMNSVNETLDRHDDSVPRLNASGGLRWRKGPWRAALSVKEVSGYSDNFGTVPPEDIHVGNYTLVDVNVAYTIVRGNLHHEFYCGVRNLANQRYATFAGWKDPGRSAYIGYSLKF